MRSVAISVMCLCSIANRYTHFSIVKFCIHFLVAILQILHINLVTFPKWFIQSKKPPQGGIKIFPNIAENQNKISVQNRSENPSQKSTLGAVKFISEYFFLTDIFSYISFFNIFLWKFEISLQKSISNCISTQLCQ